MNNISEYKVIATSTKRDKNFVVLVNESIADGWQPLGGICAVYVESEDDVVVEQAMVKYKEVTRFAGIQQKDLNRDLDGKRDKNA